MTDDRPSSRPPRPTRRPTQESPLVWGLLVAIMLLAFVNYLFVALAEPTTYRVVLAVASGAFLVLSIVLLVRSSRERRRRREPDVDAAAPGDVARGDADDHPVRPDTGPDRPGDDRAV